MISKARPSTVAACSISSAGASLVGLRHSCRGSLVSVIPRRPPAVGSKAYIDVGLISSVGGSP